jgi:quercetin dioxygenase-like cupin family protein
MDRSELIATLEKDGYSVIEWTDEPEAHYPEHAHRQDEILVMLDGSMTMEISGRTHDLGPGDRLELPAGAVHVATAGPDGATYLIGR